jgi:hypothetical protein
MTRLTLTKRRLKAARCTVYEFICDDGHRYLAHSSRQSAEIWAKEKGHTFNDETGDANPPHATITKG